MGPRKPVNQHLIKYFAEQMQGVNGLNYPTTGGPAGDFLVFDGARSFVATSKDDYFSAFPINSGNIGPSGVTPGSYTNASITVDAAGLITAAAGGTSPVLSITGTPNQIDVSPTTGNPVISLANNPILPGSAGFLPPIGTTAQRAGTPTLFEIRGNSDLNYLETWTGAAWQPIDTAGGTVTGVFGTPGQIVVSPSSPTPTISIDPTYAGQASINTLGTVTTGVWNGSLIAGTYGGTGVNNGTKTITLGGNLTTSGLFNSIFTVTAATSVTFPTTGTLATTSQLPTASALTAANDTNITLTLGGTPATALLQAASITAGWSGTLSSARGGTGVNNGSSTITIAGSHTLSGAFTSTFTFTGNTSVTFPTSGTLSTTTGTVTSIAAGTGLTGGTITGSGTIALSIPVTLVNGGTNANLSASNGGIFYSTASAGAILAGTATANQMLQSGASTTPAWSTATYPATTTINQILYSSAANAIAGLATANNGVLVTGATGIPSIAATLPTAVQGNITTLGILTTDTTIRETSTKALSVQNATLSNIFLVDTSTPLVSIGASGINVAMNLNVNQCPNTTVYMFTVAVPATAGATTTVAYPSGKGVSNIRFMQAIANQSAVVAPPNYPFNTAINYSFFASGSNMGIVTGGSWSTAATVYLWVWFA